MTQVSQQSEPTPEPTREPPVAAPGDYPNLDETLQAIVLSYEDGSKSESEAAAEAPIHHIASASVLVQVELTANIDAVDAWMGKREIEPRYADANFLPPHIYAYSPVSRLGELSQQEGVDVVKATESPLPGASGSVKMPKYNYGRDGTITKAEEPPDAPPELPVWLKGYVAPGYYAHTSPIIQEFIFRHQQDSLTDEFLASRDAVHVMEGNLVEVFMKVANPAQQVDDVISWLNGQGVTVANNVIHGDASSEYQEFWVAVPIPLLAPLAERPGVRGLQATSPRPSGPFPESEADDPYQPGSSFRQSLRQGLGTYITEGLGKAVAERGELGDESRMPRMAGHYSAPSGRRAIVPIVDHRPAFFINVPSF